MRRLGWRCRGFDKSDAVNAFADGFHVIITTGMMRFAEKDEELALVVGHEIAHNALEHVTQNTVILLLKIKYAYRDYRALLARDEIRPGEVKEMGVGVVLFPPAERGAAALSHVYLRSSEFNQKREKQSVWLPDLRRPRLLNTSDPQGRPWKVADKAWEPVPPWGYWARRYDYWVDLLSGQATVLEYFEWRFDQGLKDEEFAESALIKGVTPWRELKRPLLPVKDLSELPPKPQVRQEFWKVRKE